MASDEEMQKLRKTIDSAATVIAVLLLFLIIATCVN